MSAEELFRSDAAPGLEFDRAGRVVQVEPCRWTEADQRSWMRRWSPLHWVFLALSVALLIGLAIWGPGGAGTESGSLGNSAVLVLLLTGLGAWSYLPARHWVACTAWIVSAPLMYWTSRQAWSMVEAIPFHPATREFLVQAAAFFAFLLASTVAGVARRRVRRQLPLFSHMQAWSGMSADARDRGLTVAFVEHAVPERGGSETRALLRLLHGATRSGTVWGSVAAGWWVAVEPSRNPAWHLPASAAQAWVKLDARGRRLAA